MNLIKLYKGEFWPNTTSLVYRESQFGHSQTLIAQKIKFSIKELL